MAKKIAKKYRKEVFTLSLILVAVFCFWAIGEVKAGSFTGEKDVMSDSRPSQVSNHTITFVTETAWSNTTTFKITLAGLFVPGSVDFTDMDFSWDGSGTATELVLSGTANTANTWKATIAGNTEISFVTGNNADYLPGALKTCIVEIGTNATGGAGNAQYTNPAKSVPGSGSADVYQVNLNYAGTATDTGRTYVAIIEGVTVTATVAESLSAGISAVTTALCDTDFGDQSDATVTNTSIAFGSVTQELFYHGCHDITIGTNGSGYTITSQESDQMTAGSNTILDTLCDAGTCSESTAGTWTSAAIHGFGHGCLGASCNAAYTNTWFYRQFASIGEASPETAQALMSSASPAISTARVEYKLSVDTLQLPGDYSNTVVYIFTPTF